MTIEISDFANSILFGKTLDDKLIPGGVFSDKNLKTTFKTPLFPGRPDRLLKTGKPDFPSLKDLENSHSRGVTLHFFANHELLAMELMALMLLKFPDAPSDLRLGIAKTITEEQSHLKMYIKRMNELGVALGEIPVNTFFWDSMRDMKSPLEFLAQMSLTLEQANLDFSLFYSNAVGNVGDFDTQTLLQKVYQDEIGHVKHGLHWFNKMRKKQGTEWQEYLEQLHTPLSAMRAKGMIFDRNGRTNAGLSADFIDNLEVYSASRGRPPEVFLFNPFCEAENARNKPGFTPDKKLKEVSLDLEFIPAFLCRNSDVLFIRNQPPIPFLKNLISAGFELPEFIQYDSKEDFENNFKHAHCSGLQPWGISPEIHQSFSFIKKRLVNMDGTNSKLISSFLNQKAYADTSFNELFSKIFSTNILKEYGYENDIAEVFYDADTAIKRIKIRLLANETLMIKAPYGTSGNQVKRLHHESELTPSFIGWMDNIIKNQGTILCEQYLDKLYDLSMQCELTESGNKILGITRFITDKHHQFRGTHIAHKLRAFPSEIQQFLNCGVISEWSRIADFIARKFSDKGYFGPFGIDALIYKSGSSYELKPIVEINPRYTMGRVSLEIAKHVSYSSHALWLFLTRKEIDDRFESVENFVKFVSDKFPIEYEQGSQQRKILNGVLFTTPPNTASHVLTVLFVGEVATDFALSTALA